MTYCVGILVRDGLVMVADTRTNAGIDNIAIFRKLKIVSQKGQRTLAIATSGNLSVSQSVLSLLAEGVENPETGELDTLENQPTMFKCAQLIGRAVREVWRVDGQSMEEMTSRFNVQLLFGGQVAGGRIRMFMIYAAGNFIEVTPDTPYFQIGEHKYGKPILDRAVAYETDLYDALKIGLISMDSTMRSNLGVGPPIDVLVLRKDALAPELDFRIEPNDRYFLDLRERWSKALRDAHMQIPRPPYGDNVPGDIAPPSEDV